jgi:hypothetical protein
MHNNTSISALAKISVLFWRRGFTRSEGELRDGWDVHGTNRSLFSYPRIIIFHT